MSELGLKILQTPQLAINLSLKHLHPKLFRFLEPDTDSSFKDYKLVKNFRQLSRLLTLVNR